MAETGLLSSFGAAIQASLSVLLVMAYGAIAAKLKLLDPSSAKSISKICVKMFLPALLLTKIGSELHADSAHRYLIILLWAFICHLVSFLIGLTAHLGLKMPDWITAAIMFNNTTSYPLLLIQSLDATGILNSLIVTDETTRAAVDRAKSYFLVFSTVSSCLTFAVGPRLIDSEHAPEPQDKEEESSDLEDGNVEDGHASRSDADPRMLATDRTLLLPDNSRRLSVVPTSFFPSKPKDAYSQAPQHQRRPSGVSKKRWDGYSHVVRWWLLFFYDFLNAPLIGAVLGAIIGLIPSLHRAFFDKSEDGGIFTAWLTSSLQNIGMIFVPLPVIVAGVSLYTSMQRSKEDHAHAAAGTPWLTTLLVLLIRFIVWPVLSITVIYGLAKRTAVLGNDPMLWFAMMLMPTGPPAMKLITLVEISDADEEDEHKIAKLLMISYVVSPILAVTVVGALRATQAVI